MGSWNREYCGDCMDRNGVRMVAELVGGPGVAVALSGCLRQALNTPKVTTLGGSGLRE